MLFARENRSGKLRKRQKNCLALFLGGLMTFSVLPSSQVLADDYVANSVLEHLETQDLSSVEELPEGLYFLDSADRFFDPTRQLAASQMWEGRNDDGEFSILTRTLGHPMGLVGFEGDYALTGQTADIIVQFRTPSSVALRLLSEVNHPEARDLFNFEAVAEAAHHEFFAQMASIQLPLNSERIQVNRSYITLINGVSMRVPTDMVEAIATLPEVFAVHPNYGIFAQSVEECCGDDHIGISVARMGYEPQTPSELFMYGPIQALNISEIHDAGNRGQGIRVAVVDTGIDSNHPVFHNFHQPAEMRHFDEYGREIAPRSPYLVDGEPVYAVPGWCFIRNHPIPAEYGPHDFVPGNFAPGTSPNVRRPVWSTHGTHVSGTVAAIAPEAVMYHYRILGPAGGLTSDLIASLEMAYHDNIDVVNLSLGASANSPWSASAVASTTASLAGIVVVVSSGNYGMFFQGSIGTPATSPLVIAVGNARLGAIPNILMQGQVNNVGSAVFIDGDGMRHDIHMRLRGTGYFMDVDAFNNLGEIPFRYFPAVANTSPHYDLPYATDPYFTERVEAFRQYHFGPTGDSAGLVAVFGRGSSDFEAMRDVAIALNAAAFMIVDTVIHTSGNSLDNLSLLFEGQRTTSDHPVFTTRMGSHDIIRNNPNGRFLFNTLDLVVHPDCMHDTSSVGPVGFTNHIGPHVVAPGFRVFSTMPSAVVNRYEGQDIWHNAYHQMTGTSMASPAVAGIATLLLSRHPDATPYEVKARIMNSARPLEYMCEHKQQHLGRDHFSVFHVGAGFANPVPAINNTAFAVVRNYVPYMEILLGESVPTLINEVVSDLSFGAVATGTYDELVVEIRNAGSDPWSHSVLWNVGNPASTLQEVNREVEDGTLYITMRITVAAGADEPWHEGNVIFTNGAESLTMPFAAMTPQPLTVDTGENAHFGIWRPIVSNFAIEYLGQFDPRHVRSEEHINEGSNPIGHTFFSNMSLASIRLNDPALPVNSFGNPRPVDMVYVLYCQDTGEVLEGPYYAGTFSMNAGQNLVLGGHVEGRFQGLRDFDPETFDIYNVPPLETIALTPGLWTSYFNIRDEHYPLVVSLGDFVVVGIDEMPSLVLDNDGQFFFDENDTYVQITGRLDSWGIDLAIEAGLVTDRTIQIDGVTFRNRRSFDYTAAWIADGSIHWTQPGTPTDWSMRQRINPDGTFTINYPISNAMRSTNEYEVKFQAVEGLDDVPFVLFFIQVGAQVSYVETATLINMDADPTELLSITIRGEQAARRAGGGHNWDFTLPYGTPVASITADDIMATAMHPNSTVGTIASLAPGMFQIPVTPQGAIFPTVHSLFITTATDPGVVRLVHNLETLTQAMEDIMEVDIIRFAPNTNINVAGLDQGTTPLFVVPSGANVVIEGANSTVIVTGNLGPMFAVQPGANIEFRDISFGGERILNVFGQLMDNRRTVVQILASNEENPSAARVALRGAAFNHVTNGIAVINGAVGAVIDIHNSTFADASGNVIMVTNPDGYTAVNVNDSIFNMRNPVNGNRAGSVFSGGGPGTFTFNDVDISGAVNAINATVAGGTIIFSSGTIQDSNNALQAGGQLTNMTEPATIIMNGGQLFDNTNGINLGGHGNMFILNDGYVRNNTAHGVLFGGSVPNPDSQPNSLPRGGNQLIINGGSIINNAQNGIQIAMNNAAFTPESLGNRVVMNGGEISGNGDFAVNIMSGQAEMSFTFDGGNVLGGIQTAGVVNINTADDEAESFASSIYVITGNAGAGAFLTSVSGVVNIRGLVDLSNQPFGNAVEMIGDNTILNIIGGKIVGAPNHAVFATGDDVNINMNGGRIEGSRNVSGDAVGSAIAMTGANPTLTVTGNTHPSYIVGNHAYAGAIFVSSFDNVNIANTTIFGLNTSVSGTRVHNHLANLHSGTVGAQAVSYGNHPFNNLDIYTLSITLPITYTRVVTFDVDGTGGTIIATVNGTEIQSGDRIPVGSTVEFVGIPAEGYVVQDWTLGFGANVASDDAFGENDDVALPTFTLRNLRFDHHVTVAFRYVGIEDPTLRIYLETIGEGHLYRVIEVEGEDGTVKIMNESLKGKGYIDVPFYTPISFLASPATGWTWNNGWEIEIVADGNSTTGLTYTFENRTLNGFTIAAFPSTLGIERVILTVRFDFVGTGGSPLPTLPGTPHRPQRPTPEQPPAVDAPPSIGIEAPADRPVIISPPVQNPDRPSRPPVTTPPTNDTPSLEV